MVSDWRPVLDKIDDIVAKDIWDDTNGSRHEVLVGRPAPVPADIGKPTATWYCPLYIEGITPRIPPVFGAGPVDALMNAMTLVRSFFHFAHGIDYHQNDERILNELKKPPR